MKHYLRYKIQWCIDYVSVLKYLNVGTQHELFYDVRIVNVIIATISLLGKQDNIDNHNKLQFYRFIVVHECFYNINTFLKFLPFIFYKILGI